MIKIVQSGNAGDTKYLFDMHRFRAKVFMEKMGWDVTVSQDGLETDQFDCPEAAYFLALDSHEKVIGTWRLIPTTLPTMIEKVWPDFLNSIDIPADPFVWEASRFAVSSPHGATREGLAEVNRATQELFVALTEACLLCGIEEVYTLYDHRICRLIKRLGCKPFKISRDIRVDGLPSKVGAFKTNSDMLLAIRSRCTEEFPPLKLSDLPPCLAQLRQSHIRSKADTYSSFMATRV